MVPRVPTVLYLHGFASSPAGRKATLLRETLEPEGYRVVAPDLNQPSFRELDFEAMVAEAVRVSGAERPSVVVASSLGALVALAAARAGGLSAPLVLVAPALGFGSRWIEKLAPGDPVRFFHHGQGRELEVHRRFFEGMAANTIDREPPPQQVVVVMGEEDESVPYEGVAAAWRRWESSGRLAAGSRFVPVPGGDHGLIGSVDTIAGLIRSV
jgi:pimeloyl-ACP methyl ester carboxylesterase